jgi:geranylgeranyl diphosphate synthase, type II
VGRRPGSARAGSERCKQKAALSSSPALRPRAGRRPFAPSAFCLIPTRPGRVRFSALSFAPRHLTFRARMGLNDYLRERQKQIDRALDRFLPKAAAKPATIHRAMRYSLFAGGKRLRPILAVAAAEACGGTAARALPAACAVECIHTYSLIHDDLPCMDDDDLRRGRPTSHKVYGEGIAVLAGDALLTIAFEILAQAAPTPRYKAPALIAELATASGSRWLIAGQVMDLEGEGKKITRQQLRFIHQAKTAALLTTSIRLGAMSANASAEKLRALTDFGQALGLAFQIIDDILDVTQTTEKLGKTAGKDAAATKATYPALFGLDHSRREAQRLTVAAHEALAPFRAKGERLHELADHLLQREY